MKIKKTAYLGLLLSAALITGYIEFLLPPISGIPGVKLGLSNIVTLITMELFGKKDAFLVLISRILLSGLLFGSIFSLIFSLSGGLLAFGAMALSSRIREISITGVSILGAVAHNMGQLIAAVFLVKELKIIYYGPLLLFFGLLTGFLTGMIAGLVIRPLRAAIKDRDTVN